MSSTALACDFCPFGPDLQEDWDRLTPLEKNFKFDEYGLYAITPHLYSRPIVSRIKGTHVVDASCSIGGMTIALALAGKMVTAIELDRKRLDLARQNAEIAGVSDRITFVEGNSLEILPDLAADAVFFDGQWAGPEQGSGRAFGLEHFLPDGRSFLNVAFRVTDEVAIRIPPHFRFSDLDSFGRKFTIEPTQIDERIRGYSVYFRGKAS